MKKTLTVTLLLFAFVMLASMVLADTDVTVTGEVRTRTELSDRLFDPDNKMQKTTLLRTRVNLEARKDDNATAFIQFQDSRTLGGMTQNGDWASGDLADGKNVDLHQAYIQLDKIWWDDIGGMIGRFEVNFGNERVFGGVDWSNVGRSWEGAMSWYGTDKMKLTGFLLKRTERDRDDGNADFDVYGFYYSNKKLYMDLFGVYEYDALAVDTTASGNNVAGTKRMSFGMYYTREHKHMDYILNAVLQTGDVGMAGVDIGQAVGEEYDVSAYMIAFEAGYNFDTEKKPRFAIGIDLTSGDDDASDGKVKTYSNLYPTTHKFQGYMDYFVNTSGEAYANAGLMDIYLRHKCNFKPDWWMMFDWHYFKTAADYTGLSGLTTDVGMEFDLTIETNSVAGVGLVWGGSYFIPQDDFVGLADNDSGFWSYLQATIDF